MKPNSPASPRSAAWFTLAEILVAAVVLAIVSSVGLLSYFWYRQSAENAVRLGDLASLKSALQDSRDRTWRYPVPDSWTGVSYSGALAWKQGEAGDSVAAAVGAPRPPADPAFGVRYSYSLTSDGRQFQLAAASDGSAPSASLLVPSALASSWSAVTAGNYNGFAVPASGADGHWLVVAPSITLASLERTEIGGDGDPLRFVGDGGSALPATYSWALPRDGAEDSGFRPVPAFRGTGSLRYPDDPEGWLGFSELVADAYSGTEFAGRLPPSGEPCPLAEFGRDVVASSFAGATDAGRFARTDVAAPLECSTTSRYAAVLLQYVATFDANGGGTPSFGTKEAAEGAPVWDLPAVSRAGYAFDGWFSEAAGGTQVTASTVVTADVTWYAGWVQDPACGTANGVATVSAPASNLCAVGTASSVSSAAAAYSWTCSNAGTASSCSAPRQYVATFNANGGGTPSFGTKNVTYGTAVWTLPTVSRTGHSFNGWFTATAGGTQVTASTVVTADVTWYARWTPLTYSVSGSFGANGAGATVSVCGSNVTATSTGAFVRAGIAHGTACNNVTATRAGYACSTSTNGPPSLTANVANVAGSCVPYAAPTYPGCDTPDITLANGQVWAACNVGATTAYDGQAYPSGTAPTAAQKAYLGAFFQWGRNEDVTDLGTTATRAAAGSTSSTVVGSFVTSSTSPYDWIATQNGNLWGGGSTSLGAGTFAGQTAGDQASMKGPCAAGYHVPTQAEWYAAVSALNPAVTNTATWQNDTALATTLKLPLAGSRNSSSAAYNFQGTFGYYWASSPTGTYGYFVRLSSSQVYPANNFSRAYGFSVRCLKN